MPLATDKLTKSSSKAAVHAAISSTIRAEIKSGILHDQAVAIALSSARKHAGSRYVPSKVKVK